MVNLNKYRQHLMLSEHKFDFINLKGIKNNQYEMS